MRLISGFTLLAALALAVSAEQTESPYLEEEVATLPPIKIDKNLRKALLKALEDLEAESAEQKQESPTADELVMKVTDNLEESEPFKGATFSYFPSEGSSSPSEDNLQNSTFIETEKLEVGEPQVSDPQVSEKAAFQKYDVLLGDKEIIEKSPESQPVDQILTRSVKTSGNKANSIEQSSKEREEKESLTLSSSNGIASANSLIPPSPTPPSPKVKPTPAPSKNQTSNNKPGDSEVKIFQAPLVAAFTVQQDEQGIAKSVLPLYKPGSDNQGLSLQEQLDFKQQLLEKQLAELQQQHAQQTQFLLKQQELYQEQLRQKQRQQYYQEQARLKQIEEQRKSALQLEEQKVQQLRQQFSNLQGAFSQNNFLSFQPPVKTNNVQFQPSVSLQLPNTGHPPAFQPNNVHEQLRLQQFQRQQLIQQHAQQLQLQRQQAILHQQQRLQQSFPGFQTSLELPAPVQATRFNRQEAFGSVGNFGINDNRQQQAVPQALTQQALPQLQNPQPFHQFSTRNHLPLEPPRIPAQNFLNYNQFNFRPQPPRPQTPARQIQNLLFQSGVAGGLNTPQGHTNEDLNIVSKVLALNVGAVPLKNIKYNEEGFARA